MTEEVHVSVRFFVHLSVPYQGLYAAFSNRSLRVFVLSFIFHVISLAVVMELSLECLQCQSDDPWYTAVE